jgi:hypothetical protein
MLHPATRLEQVDLAIGLGVVATGPIPRGSITWVKDPLDRVLAPAEVAALPSICAGDLEHYSWVDRSGNYVLCWDIARYVNHACDPNCLATEWGFEIAVRDIAAGEELTNDYANIGMLPREQMRCHCGAPGCRGLVSPLDAAARAPLWSDAIAQAATRLTQVPQPLWTLLPDALQSDLRQRHAP